MFSCLANVLEEMQISGNLTITLKRHYECLRGTVSSAAGTELPEVPASPSLLPSPPSQTPTSWQEQESHNTCQRRTHRSHLTNKIWHTVPAQNIFSLKLVMI